MNNITDNNSKAEQAQPRQRLAGWRAPWTWTALALLAIIALVGAGRYVQTVYAQATQPSPYTRVQFQMKPPVPTADEQFGYALDMERSGGQDYTIVGASGEQAYVWELLNSEGENNGRDWRIDREPDNPPEGTPQNVVGILSGSDTVAGDQFGRAVSMSRNFAVVGAPGHDQPAGDAGAAYVFDRLDTKQPDPASKAPWSQVFKLSATDAAAGDAFGTSVDVWGEDDNLMTDALGRAVVGAPNKDGGAGAAYAYNLNTALPAPTSLRLQPTNPSVANDLFGQSVAIYNGRIFVGAPGANGGQGAVYVFSYDAAANTATQQGAALAAPDGVAGDQFGWQIDVSEDGNTLAISAIGAASGGAAGAGAAYIFNFGGGVYSFSQKLTASSFSQNAQFGYSLAFGRGNPFARDGLVVGAPGPGDAASSAYYFKRSGGMWTEFSELDALGSGDNSLYGQAVGFVRGRIGVGAPETNSTVNMTTTLENVGSAYIHFVETGTLQVVKNVEPDNAATNWEVVINGPSSSSATFAGDGSTDVTEVLNGFYLISESAGADTNGDLYTTSYSCTIDGVEALNSVGDGTPRDIPVRVNRDTDVVCTFTNTLNSATPASLTVVKDVQPDDSRTNWDITVSDSMSPTNVIAMTTLSGDGGTTFENVVPGSYTVSEAAGVNTTDELYDSQYSCTADGEELISDTGRTLNVTVETNQNVVCTFTNVRKPTLQIVKDVVPNGDASSWLFTVEGPTPLSSTLADNGDTGKQIVAAGNYSIVETAAPDSGTDASQYRSRYVCTANGEEIAAGESGDVTLAITQGQDVICRFTNTRNDATVGTLVIEKNVVPDDDDSTWAFTVDGPTSEDVSLQGDGSSQALELTPGTYTIVETDDGDANLDDYSTSYRCSNGQASDGREVSVEVNAGDVLTCVFTNTSAAVPPTATPLPGSTSTATPVPPTATPVPPTVTATPIPGSTATPIPGSTATPIPGSTPTPIPGSTPTPIPGSTPTPGDGNIYLPLIVKPQE